MKLNKLKRRKIYLKAAQHIDSHSFGSYLMCNVLDIILFPRRCKIFDLHELWLFRPDDANDNMGWTANESMSVEEKRKLRVTILLFAYHLTFTENID